MPNTASPDDSAVRESRAPVAVIGLGNPILSDDAVGLTLTRALEERLHGADIDFWEAYHAGLELLDLLDGRRVVHIIDAMLTGKHAPGTLVRVRHEELPRCMTLAGSHELDLSSAVALGERLGYRMPEQIVIWGIEVRDPFTVAERLTPEVAAAVPRCLEQIERAL